MESKNVPTEDVITKECQICAFTRCPTWRVQVEMVYVAFLHVIFIQTLFGRTPVFCRRLLGVL
jgi:hypothetical protein